MKIVCAASDWWKLSIHYMFEGDGEGELSREGVIAKQINNIVL